jgi:hypothetical protein
VAPLKPGLVGDPHHLVAHMQGIPSALEGMVLERDPRLFDKPLAEQDAVARHSCDVALQAAQVR